VKKDKNILNNTTAADRTHVKGKGKLIVRKLKKGKIKTISE